MTIRRIVLLALVAAIVAGCPSDRSSTPIVTPDYHALHERWDRECKPAKSVLALIQCQERTK